MPEKLNHLGIIMDGNRRFAKKLMLSPWKGHEWGAKKIESVLDWCMEEGIHEITLWAFSIENLDRPKEEFNYLMNIFEKEFLSIRTNEKIIKNNVRVRVIGRPDLLPENVRSAIKDAEDATKDNRDYRVNFALAYGGRQEIIDAAKALALDIKNSSLDLDGLTPETFRKYLYAKDSSDPDLIIRTSGEKRTSGFMIWNAAYSELYFTDKLWPEFEKKDLLMAIEDYNARQRRFGR